jgi:hypothetical protein
MVYGTSYELAVAWRTGAEASFSKSEVGIGLPPVDAQGFRLLTCFVGQLLPNSFSGIWHHC